MSAGATVDRDQLAVLRRLRDQLGIDQVEVLEVAADLPPGRSPTPAPPAAPAPAQHYQGSLIDRPPAWTTPGHPGACPFCGSTHVRWTWKPDGTPTRESVRCFGCGWVETRPYLQGA
jgi:hypothetical protein